jgi:hypothetical protein
MDIYTQAITQAKHAAQAAVMSLAFPPNENPGRPNERRTMDCQTDNRLKYPA